MGRKFICSKLLATIISVEFILSLAKDHSHVHPEVYSAFAKQLLYLNKPLIAVYLCNMAKEIKPIKRSKQLTPLSKDHHEGLLFAWKIRQGLKNEAETKLIAEYVHWFWKNHLEEHFTEEEQILAPYLPADNELLKQMIDEHQNIEALIRINEEIPDKTLLAQLAQAIDDHIRFEERQLFPYAEKVITEEQLNDIYERLSKEPVQCEKWEREFWIAN